MRIDTIYVGTNEKEIESTLSAWFSLAEIWGAVMLIDEADIYLEIRSTGDLQRNSLVSGVYTPELVDIILDILQRSSDRWNITGVSYS